MSDKEGSGPSSGEDTGFTSHLVQALKDPQVAAQFRNAMAPLITPLKDALQQNTAQIGILRAQLAERDDTIQNLQSHVDLDTGILWFLSVVEHFACRCPVPPAAPGHRQTQ